jgi:phenylacetate-CoA ligase
MKRVLGSLAVLTNLRGQNRAPFLERSRVECRRDARVRRIVAHAAATVPYYRELFARERIDPRAIATAHDLERLPLLDRDRLRSDPRAFLSESGRARGALALRSSGTTGTPLEIHHDPHSVLANIAFGERERAPVIRLAGGSFRPRELHVGYETSNFRKILAFHETHTLLPRPRRTQVSMLAPLDAIVAEIDRLRPDVLTAYGSFVDLLFRVVAAREVAMHLPKVVMYVGETLAVERQREIESRFGVHVMSRYCAVEAFKIGFYCEARTGFHLHEDLTHVRLVRRDGTAAAPGEPGEVVLSNLVNEATVLLNAPMGDVAVLSEEPCPCGRSFRLLSRVEGRVEDPLPLATGEVLHPRAVWAALKDDPDVLQYRLVQHELRRFELDLVTRDERCFAAVSERARRALVPLLGEDTHLEVVHDPALGREERARTGKFRAVRSLVGSPAAREKGLHPDSP